MLAVILIFIVWTGKEEEVINAVGQLIDAGRQGIEWIFPRISSAGAGGAPQTEL